MYRRISPASPENRLAPAPLALLVLLTLGGTAA